MDDDMELKWLEDLIALLEEQSFSRAAARRNITQSAFSRRIQSLEDWFGCKLVDRNTKPVRLLENSFLIRPHVWELINQFYQLRNRVKLNNHSPHRVIFAIQDALGLSVIPNIATNLTIELNARRKNGVITDFSFQVGSREGCIKKLEQSEADFIICYENEKQKTSLSKKRYNNFSWMKDRLIPIANREIFDDVTRNAQLKSKIPFIAYPSDSFFGATIAASSVEHDFIDYNLERVCEAESEVALREMARSGLGLAWLPHSIIAEDLKSGDIVDLSDYLPYYKFDVMIYSSRLVPATCEIFDLLVALRTRRASAIPRETAAEISAP